MQSVCYLLRDLASIHSMASFQAILTAIKEVAIPRMTSFHSQISPVEVEVMFMEEEAGKPSKTDSIKSQISSKTSRGKKDSTKRRHQRHHQ